MRVEFTKDHILRVFAGAHAIAGAADPETDPHLAVSENLPLREWISGMDLIPEWKALHKAYNVSFNASVPKTDFRNLYYSKKSTIGDLAALLARYSTPINVPIWKFAGQPCRKGSVLRFVLRELETALGNRRRLHPQDALNGLAKSRDWSWVERLNCLFPGTLPAPTEISHFRLLPGAVRRPRQAGYAALAASPIIALVGYMISQPFLAVSGALALATSFLLLYMQRKILKLPKTRHHVFLGISTIRSYSELAFKNL